MILRPRSVMPAVISLAASVLRTTPHPTRRGQDQTARCLRWTGNGPETLKHLHGLPLPLVGVAGDLGLGFGKAAEQFPFGKGWTGFERIQSGFAETSTLKTLRSMSLWRLTSSF